MGLVGCGPDGETTAKSDSSAPIIEGVTGAEDPVDPGAERRLAVTAHSVGEALPGGSGADASSGGSGADTGTDSTGNGRSASGWLGEGLTASWTVADGGWSLEGEGAEASLTAPGRYNASTTVTVTVTNDDDQSRSAEVVVSTGENAEPTISELTADPNPADPDSVVDLEVDAADARGDELDYDWKAPANWSFKAKNGSTAELQTPSTGGTFADIKVTVTDGFGGEATSQIRVEVPRNARPNIASVTATPPQVAPSKKTTLEALATDPEGGQLTYSWQVPSGWSASATDKPTIELTAPSSYGVSESVEVTVTDPEGATATGSVTVSTPENDGPIIASLDATPKSVAAGDTIDLRVRASDPNGDSLTYNWSVGDPQKWTLTANGDTASLQSPGTPGVSTSVDLEVTDQEGKKATASVVVSTNANRAPTVSSVVANPQLLAPGGSTTLTASASDPDGDSLSYDWKVPNKWSKSGSGNQITVTAPSSYGASGLVEVTVDDGQGETAKGTALVQTEKNQAPVLSALTANPQSVAPGAQVTVDATASDPNGDSLSYSWTAPQGWSKSGSGSQITLTAPGSYGNSGIVRVTVSDGHGGSTKGSVLVNTDRNQSPIISSVVANPVIVPPGGTSTLDVTASDPNGDSLNYGWQVPSGWTQMGSGQQISVQAPTKSGVSATIQVTVSDGKGGQSQSAVVVQTSSNRNPTISKLAATPNPVLQNAETTVEAKAADPDGDQLTYNWKIGNGNWSKSGSGATISLKAPNNGSSSTTVSVTVTDGRGGQASASVTVKTKACPSARGNCDGQASNGCEVDLDTDDNNCGGCGNACSGGDRCSGGMCKSFPSKCQTGTGPDYGNDYVVCEADATSAWISHKNYTGGDNYYNAEKICRNLGYSGVDKMGGNCDVVCGYCESGTTSCSNTGNKTFDGNGQSSTKLGHTVTWLCK